MKRHYHKGISLFALGLLFALAQPASAIADESKLSDMETKALSKLHFENQQAMKLGELALSKDASTAVKQFAQMLITEHRATDAELVQIARAKGASIDRYVADAPAERLTLER